MRIAIESRGEAGLRRHTERLRRALEARRPGSIVERDGDLAFTPSYLLPAPSGPEVVVVHDLTERTRPRLAERLAHGSRIVCASRATAGKIPEAEPTVIHPGVDGAVFSPDASRDREPFIAVIGNQGPLLDAFPVVRARLRACRMVMVGGSAPKSPPPAVDFVGMLDESDLVELYRRALMVVIPGLYEGYGPSVLEAMACGAPVACANTPQLIEFAGESARYFDPHDARSIAEAMAALARDEDEREERSRRGIARASEFRWERTASRLWDLFEEVVS